MVNLTPLTFSVDFAPRVISIAGDTADTYNITELIAKNNSLSVTLKFSEPITGLTTTDIVTAGVGITPTLNFNNGDTEATLTIEIAATTQATLELHIDKGDYNDTVNDNNETDYTFPQVYRIDNVQPSIESFTDIALPITNKASFTFDITFSENISTDTFTTE